MTNTPESDPRSPAADDCTGLWAEAWTPTRREGEEVTLSQIVHEAIGSASTCWENVREAGIFNSERAQWVAGGAVAAIERVIWEQQNPIAELCAPPKECGMPEQSAEDRRRQLERRQDQADLIDLILHYKNPASEEARMRQIRLVME